MLDLGGAPSGLNDKKTGRINANKNCKVQAICFDFDVLTRSVDSAEAEIKKKARELESQTSDLGKVVAPNVSAVQEFADLLQVDLPGRDKAASRPEEEDDDLSLLTGEKTKDAEKEKKEKKSTAAPGSDIRAKYAAKLAKKIEGGIAGVNLANYEKEINLKKGDAAGHMEARKIAAAEPVASRWMAKTGTGALLSFLTQRSMKINLLPRPSQEIDLKVGERMEDFKKQLNDVSFGLLCKDGTLGAARAVVESLESLHLDPSLVMLVSDRDDYLKAAKEAGMVTCRIRPLNSPRGNISAHFSVPTVPEVEEVINEVNGISFNAVLKSR
jgi:hypothetical protein